MSAHCSDLVRAGDQLPPGDGLAAGLVQDGAVGDAGLGPGHTAHRALLGPAHSEILCINILKKTLILILNFLVLHTLEKTVKPNFKLPEI